jgi:O-antigen/teichoic acid export membrane protein
MVQALGFVCGILVIRLLPVEEYAWYVLANTMLGAMTVLSDGGISAGVMAEGGKVWQDKEKLGVVLATGLDLRRKFAIGSLVIFVPILLSLMTYHGASLLVAVMITISIIPAFYAALSDNLFQIPIKLHQAIPQLQKNQVNVALGRLVLNAALLFLFPLTAVAIIANGIPRIFGNYRLSSISAQYAIIDVKSDYKIRKEIIKVVKRMMPGVAYYAASGQITIWLISIFGNTTSIAQLGAIGRVSALLSIVNALLVTLVVPRFSRGNKKTRELRSIFFKSQISLVLILLLFLIFTKLTAPYILWVLGSQYKHLEIELMLAVLAACILMLSGLTFSLSTSKGWVLHPIWSIGLNIITLVVAVNLFNVSTLLGVLYLNLFVALIQYLMNSSFCFWKINTI